MPPDGLALGRLRSEAENCKFSADCDALATGDHQYSPVYLASLVGPATTIKAIAAALNSRRSIVLSAKDCGACCPDYGDRSRFFVTDNAYGYTCYRSKLGYDTWHLLAISRNPNFLPTYSVESVMQKLTSQQFTTPLLRSWGPRLVKDLLYEERLEKLTCFQCDCALLSLNDTGLDEIVSRGVSQHLYPIAKESA
jgi:hypothetical protein